MHCPFDINDLTNDTRLNSLAASTRVGWFFMGASRRSDENKVFKMIILAHERKSLSVSNPRGIGFIFLLLGFETDRTVVRRFFGENLLMVGSRNEGTFLEVVKHAKETQSRTMVYLFGRNTTHLQKKSKTSSSVEGCSRKIPERTTILERTLFS